MLLETSKFGVSQLNETIKKISNLDEDKKNIKPLNSKLMKLREHRRRKIKMM